MIAGIRFTILLCSALAGLAITDIGHGLVETPRDNDARDLIARCRNAISDSNSLECALEIRPTTATTLGCTHRFVLASPNKVRFELVTTSAAERLRLAGRETDDPDVNQKQSSTLAGALTDPEIDLICDGIHLVLFSPATKRFVSTSAPRDLHSVLESVHARGGAAVLLNQLNVLLFQKELIDRVSYEGIVTINGRRAHRIVAEWDEAEPPSKPEGDDGKTRFTICLDAEPGAQPLPLRLTYSHVIGGLPDWMQEAARQRGLDVPAHYTSAMRVEPTLLFDPWIVGQSVADSQFRFNATDDMQEVQEPTSLEMPLAKRSLKKTADLVGSHFPNVQFDLLSGGRATMEEFRNQMVLVLFWSSRSQRCSQFLEEAQRVVRGKGNSVLLGMNAGENRRVVENTVGERRWDNPVALDPDGRVRQSCAVLMTPTAILIDRKGIVQRVYDGRNQNFGEDLERDLSALNAGPSE